jgi:glycosyltransferase involved in cell wall biosynthesis
MNTKTLCKDYKVAVLLPTYNNCLTLEQVIFDALEYSSDVIVVNDGSTDKTTEILAKYSSQTTQVSYAQNRGKGWALRCGFEKAVTLGYDYVITMDTDGQHFAKDCVVFLEALKESPDALYIGARNMDQASVPTKSSFGNKFSNFWFKLETGIEMPDTQSGYRMYPVRKMKDIKFWTEKFEFEIEVIVRSAWADIPVKSVPVSVYYPSKEERITHFRPWQDFTRISILNTIFVIWTFAYIKPKNFFRYIQKKKISTLLKDHLLIPTETPLQKSAAVSLGLFMGIAPFWGFQMMIVYFLCRIFRLNTALSLIVSNISIPPMIPLILYGSYRTGAIFYGASAVHLYFSKDITMEMIHIHFMQYFIGALMLATGMSIVGGIVTYFLASILKRKLTIVS